MLHVESSLAVLAYCRLGLHWTWDLEFSRCYSCSLKWKKLSYACPEAGLSPSATISGTHHWHAGSCAHSCHIEGSSLWQPNHSKWQFAKALLFLLQPGWVGKVAGHINLVRSSPVRTSACSLRSPRPEELRCSGRIRNFPSTSLISLTVVDVMPLEPLWHIVDTNASTC